MKKIILLITTAALLCAGSFAQQGTVSVGEPDPALIGADSGKQSLREISVDKFESEGSWNARISADDGIIAARLFEGSPASKEPLASEDGKGLTDTNVLGVKAEFFRRGFNTMYVTPARPLPIEGVTKTVSFWVIGRNYNHEVSLLVKDYFGNNFELYVGNLNFSGWKKMSVAIPSSPDGINGIVQYDPHYGDKPGLSITGFKIVCDPSQAFGSYFVYFDDLRAVTDLYALENRDVDDMKDNW